MEWKHIKKLVCIKKRELLQYMHTSILTVEQYNQVAGVCVCVMFMSSFSVSDFTI